MKIYNSGVDKKRNGQEALQEYITSLRLGKILDAVDDTYWNISKDDY